VRGGLVGSEVGLLGARRSWVAWARMGIPNWLMDILIRPTSPRASTASPLPLRLDPLRLETRDSGNRINYQNMYGSIRSHDDFIDSLTDFQANTKNISLAFRILYLYGKPIL